MNPSDQKDGRDEKAVPVFRRDPTPLCPTGVLLELLVMQREVDEGFVKLKQENSPLCASSRDILYRPLIVVLRGMGALGTFKLDYLIAAWKRHVQSGNPDVEYLNNISATFKTIFDGLEKTAPTN